MKSLRFILVFTLAQITVFQAQAETLANAMEQCRQVSNSLKRLVCYDQLAQRAGGLEDSEVPEIYRQRSVPGNAQANIGPSDVAQNPSSQSTFGLEKQIRRQQSSEVPEISMIVAKVKEAPHGHLIITMEDGQVWRQNDAERFIIKPGQRVTIERGIFGSFYMEYDGRRTQVKRTK